MRGAIKMYEEQGGRETTEFARPTGLLRSHSNEHLGYRNCGKFIDLLRASKLLGKDSASLSWWVGCLVTWLSCLVS
jgi:hypothetical protein